MYQRVNSDEFKYKKVIANDIAKIINALTAFKTEMFSKQHNKITGHAMMEENCSYQLNQTNQLRLSNLRKRVHSQEF